MAGGKKKETLTPEDRLQAALVPENEQPYEVPGNWCWIKLGLLLQSSKEKTDEFSDADLKYVGLEHMQKDGGIIAYDSADGVKSLKNVFHPGQILYGKLRPYLNKHDIATFDGVCSTDILVFNAISVTIPKFINFFLDQDTFIAYAVSNSKGINLPRVSESVVLDAKCPLPPFAEQQRIVDRIESLFAKLDEAKQKAQDALDSFETRKAAILHKAFTGELTAQWRKEHGVGMESWENISVSELCHSLKYGTAKKSSSEGKVVVIRMGNLQDGEINWDDLAYSNDKEDIEKYKLIPGDVLFNRTNSPALVGKTSIYRGEYPAIYAGYLIKLDYDRSRVIGDYLNYSLNTVSAKEYCNSVKTDGVNQSNINAKKIGAYRFDMPKISEQTEIVRILDDLLAKEQQAKEAAEKVLEQIDLIKKSILARAFRGELGTNDPSEESAAELLRQVLSASDR